MAETDEFDRDKINTIRLKVNRVNMIQTLNIDDDFLSDLMKLRIIYFQEATKIMEARSREEKVKNLIDCLLNKTNHTRKDWYNQFRMILLERNYKDLVVFLDNTIIKKPKFVSKFSNQFPLSTVSLTDASQITNSDNSFDINNGRNNLFNTLDYYAKNVDLTEINEKSLERLIENIQIYTEPPNVLINELEQSKNDGDDATQITNENDSFKLFKKLELIYYLYKSNHESLKKIFLLDTLIVFDILNSSNTHMYMKYFKSLLEKNSIDMLKFLKDLLVDALRSETEILKLKLYDSLDFLVFRLVTILKQNERFTYADELLKEYLKYIELILKTNREFNYQFNQECQKNINLMLISKFYTLTNLIIVKMNLFKFNDAIHLSNKINELVKQNSLLSNVDFTHFYYAIGHVYFEQGNFNYSFDYINRSLSTLNYFDELVIDIICSSSLIYASKWKLAKAESLSILAIQLAKDIYGRNHSQFLKALINYCHFSNEFIQDQSSIQIAEYTLKLAKKVFGFDSIVVADAYRVVSKALIANKEFKDDLYYDYAQRAFKIASEQYSNDNPKLVVYQLNLALALQSRSIYTVNRFEAYSFHIRKVDINEAHNLGIKALETFIDVFGEKNISTAKIYRILGSTYFYMNRHPDANISHRNSLEIFEHCLPNNDLHYLLAKSTYGTFLKMIGKIDEAIEILLEVVNNLKLEELNNILGFCKWIPSTYLNLSECYEVKKSEELINYYRKQADNLRLVALQKSYVKHDILNVEIYRKPPRDLKNYLKEIVQ